MAIRVFYTVFCGFLYFMTCFHEVESINEERRLVSNLLKNYKTTGIKMRPVTNATETVEVKVGITLIKTVGFHEKDETLKLMVWFEKEWKDELLQWNPSDYGGVQNLHLPPSAIWTPDIALYNGFMYKTGTGDVVPEFAQELAIVSNNGQVFLASQLLVTQSSCSIDIEQFPFDEQTCKLKFASWSYDGFRLDLDLRSSRVDIANYVPNGWWELRNITGTRNEVFYSCCPEPFPDVTFTVTLKRRVAPYCYLLVSLAILSSLSLLIFFMPVHVYYRVTYGLGLLVGFFLLLLLINDLVPPTALSSPLIAVYVMCIMIILSVAMVTSVVISYVYNLPENKPMPKKLSVLLSTRLASLCCLSNRENEDADANTDDKESTNRKCRHDWRLLAKVMDRILMLIYLVLLILDVMFTFPKPKFGDV